MADIEKVMSWLVGFAEPDWRECYRDSEVQETARQALYLIDEMLKEQETVKPKIDAFGHPYCPKCKILVYETWEFCPHCGAKMEWR